MIRFIGVLAISLLFIELGFCQSTPLASVEWRAYISDSKTSPEDIKKEIETLRKINTDKSNAMVGYVYLYSKHVQDYKKAVEISEPLAESGLPLAQYVMGKAYLNGHGVVKNLQKGILWYQKAANNGDPFALNNLGSIYFNGSDGVNKNLEKAEELFKKAAISGNMVACKNLGLLYQEKNNLQEAFFWFRVAAEEGNVDAKKKLGLMYYHGKGVEKDYGKSFNWLIDVAKEGDDFAQYVIARMYDLGDGVEINWAEAFSWYQKSAENGNSRAQCYLGTFYLFGVGGAEKSEELAINWFKKSADQDNDDAQMYLSVLEDIELYKNKRFINKKSEKNESYLQVEYSDFKEPLVFDKLGNSWEKTVHFRNDTWYDCSIFPTTSVLSERNTANIERHPSDEIYFDKYSPSPKFKEGIDTHKVFVLSDKPRRTIGYMYIVGAFGNDYLILKLPYAFCWQPE